MPLQSGSLHWLRVVGWLCNSACYGEAYLDHPRQSSSVSALGTAQREAHRLKDAAEITNYV